MTNNLILFNPSMGSDTKLDLVPEELIRNVFVPLGAQDAELPEIRENVADAIEGLSKNYMRRNPDVVENLLDKIAELSDTRRRFHAPYELILNAIMDNPVAIKKICSMDDTSSPRQVLNEILTSNDNLEDDDEDDDNDSNLYLNLMAI